MRSFDAGTQLVFVGGGVSSDLVMQRPPAPRVLVAGSRDDDVIGDDPVPRPATKLVGMRISHPELKITSTWDIQLLGDDVLGVASTFSTGSVRSVGFSVLDSSAMMAMSVPRPEPSERLRSTEGPQFSVLHTVTPYAKGEFALSSSHLSFATFRAFTRLPRSRVAFCPKPTVVRTLNWVSGKRDGVCFTCDANVPGNSVWDVETCSPSSICSISKTCVRFDLEKAKAEATRYSIAAALGHAAVKRQSWDDFRAEGIFLPSVDGHTAGLWDFRQPELVCFDVFDSDTVRAASLAYVSSKRMLAFGCHSELGVGGGGSYRFYVLDERRPTKVLHKWEDADGTMFLSSRLVPFETPDGVGILAGIRHYLKLYSFPDGKELLSIAVKNQCHAAEVIGPLNGDSSFSRADEAERFAMVLTRPLVGRVRVGAIVLKAPAWVR